VYEPITVEVDRAHGEGKYRSYTINFIGRLIRIVEAGNTTMRLYEWADRGRLLYLVHVEEDKPGRPPRRTLYPFINTHSGGATPRKGYTAEEVSRAYPEFAAEKCLGLTEDDDDGSPGEPNGGQGSPVESREDKPNSSGSAGSGEPSEAKTQHPPKQYPREEKDSDSGFTGFTPEQEQRIRKLVDEGMSEKLAREEVLGKGWVEP
jgi:hypothetical protein